MLVELEDIHKHYGSICANDGVTLRVEPGTIHGVLGENGAGKSTLMKVLAGYVKKSSGTIRIDRNVVELGAPAEASSVGIGMLHQEPLDFPSLSVLENFMIGRAGGLASKKKTYRKRLFLLNRRFGFALHPEALVSGLTIGERQQLEILRIMDLGVRVLILDEPTTGISDIQKEVLFQALKKMTSEGRSVVLVSHKLEDATALCDAVTVLRRGRVAGRMKAPFDARGILEMMFDALPEAPSRRRAALGKVLLRMDRVWGDGGRTGLKDCSIEVHRGEVVGLAGLEGSGQGVFLRIASGLKSPAKGVLSLDGRVMKGRDHHDFKEAGATFLPASRLEEGLIPGLSIQDHFALQCVRRSFLIRRTEASGRAKDKISLFRINGAPQTPVETLSGGNQQRLLLSFLPKAPLLLLLENPTRGLDVDSALWFWRHIQDCRTEETAIIFSSAELDEIVMAADRVLVFYEGRVIRDLRIGETDIQELGRAIAGRI